MPSIEPGYFCLGLERVKNIIKDSSGISIYTHNNADPDGIASACAFAYITKILNNRINVKIIVPESIGIESRDMVKICEEHGIEVNIVKKIGDENRVLGDTCVIVDVASLEQLKSIKNIIHKCNNIIVIDHHSYREEIEQGLSREIISFIDSKASSTSEIVYNITKCLGILLTKDIMELLIAGILWDTKRFLRSSANTFKIVGELIENGADYERAQGLISVPKPSYSRIARIKCILRHRGYKITLPRGEVFIAISEIGAYESDCASALISLGYDIALVATEDESLNVYRIVYRARDEVVDNMGLDVYMAILKRLVLTFGGSGGGHKGAGAAILGTNSMSLILKEIIRILKEISGNKVVVLEEERVS